jgi:hypothetical protein
MVVQHGRLALVSCGRAPASGPNVRQRAVDGKGMRHWLRVQRMRREKES